MLQKARHNILRFKVFLLTGILLSACFREVNYDPVYFGDQSYLAFDNCEVFFDDMNQLALATIDGYDNYEGKITFYGYSNVKINNEEIENCSSYDFGKIEKESIFNINFKNNGQSLDYKLSFTSLPIVEITHKGKSIPDEPKILAKMSISDFSEGTSSYFCGIEMRGKSAMSRPKKSYGFEILDSPKTDDTKNVSLFGMKSDDDWILDGVYIDLALSRNRVSFDLWEQMQNDAIVRGMDVLPSAIKGRYVEVFLNKEYVGVYCLSQRVDGKTLNLKTDVANYGYIYKSEDWTDVTRFHGVTDTSSYNESWEGWYQIHPTESELQCWEPLYNLVDFMVNSSDTEFALRYTEYVSVDQLIDFYHLINLIKGYDNFGKNLIVATKDKHSAFYACPWDLDATWGRNWKSDERDPFGCITTFEIYNRLAEVNPNNFKEKMVERWRQLRETIYTSDNINGLFYSYYKDFTMSGASKRELLKWPISLPDIESESKYIEEYVNDRLVDLDKHFASD